MRVGAFASLCLLSALSAHAVEAPRPQGENCALTAPPAAAGEEFNHGLVLRIYPRARDISAKYTGCQIRWAPDGSKWVTVSVVAIERGGAVRVWSPDQSQTELLACRYKAGRVVTGHPDNCPAPQFLIAKSVAPGCVEKLRAAVAAGGLSAAQPAGCNHE